MFGITLENMRSRAVHVAKSLNPFGHMVGVGMPNWEHLNERRRVLLAPLSHKSRVFAMLAKDQDFVHALPERTEDLLLVFAICGEEIRCNVFLITENVLHEPIHNEKWFNEGVFHYRMNPKGEAAHVIRRARGCFYNSYDPYLSYSRPLTDEELDWADRNRMH